MAKTKHNCGLVALAILAQLIATAQSLPSFGMNKPHLLFHLGDRRAVSTNIGWGYWVGNGSNRLTYQNTDSGIYASMDIHDGSSLFS